MHVCSSGNILITSESGAKGGPLLQVLAKNTKHYTRYYTGDLKLCEICNITVKKRFLTSHCNSKSYKIQKAVPVSPCIRVIESDSKTE